jgi:hypothetical protein
VVTWTGNGVAGRTVAHNLGSVPGCIITKRTDTTGNWITYHRSLGNTDFVNLNTTAATSADNGAWDNTTPTSTTFTLGAGNTNVNGGTYVAYIFAHNAGGFGLTGTDNVISCGSFTTDGSGNATVNLGYEPQWLTVKASSTTGNWFMRDNMRGWITETAVGTSAALNANLSNAEALGGGLGLSATGFVAGGLSASTTYIYIAIRRGPMKVPTDGTKVFLPYSSASTTVDGSITTGFPVDLMFSGQKNSNNSGDNWSFVDRLRGLLVSGNATSGALKLLTTSTAAEASLTYPNAYNWWNTGVVQGYGLNGASVSYQFFRRAPGFFDEVCYTGNGAASRAVPHNLGVAPELMIVKARNLTQNWYVYNGAKPTFYLTLDTINSESNSFNLWGGTATATNFYVNDIGSTVNDSGYNFVAYLFASCPGVSKVGTYTGTGSTQTISCGFTGGARFVLIKRTDSTGDWYVWDTARGMVSGTDPSLLLNSNAAEVNANSVYTTTGGFQIVSTAAGINASGGSYIYLAIA